MAQAVPGLLRSVMFLLPLIFAVGAVLVVARWNSWHRDRSWRRSVTERFSESQHE
jgi:hypothetical protein